MATDTESGVGAVRVARLSSPPRPSPQVRGRRFQGSSGRLLYLAILGVLAVLIVPPLYVLITASVTEYDAFQPVGWTLDHLKQILSTNVTGTLVKNTAVFAVASSVLGLAGGTWFAWVCGRTNAPFKSAIYVVMFLSFAIPGIIQTIGWILLLGPRTGILNVWARALGIDSGLLNIFSMTGMVLTEALRDLPVAFLLMLVPLSSMDPSLEEAGRMSGATGWQVFRKITAPVARPSILAALILSFVRAVESFETPAVLGLPSGIRVLTTAIYVQLTGSLFPKYGLASAYAVLLMILVVGLIAVYTRMTSRTARFGTITGKGFRPAGVDLGRWRLPVGIASVLGALVSLLPVVAMLWASLLPFIAAPSASALGSVSLDNYREALANPVLSRAARNTVLVAVSTAAVVTAITFCAAWLMVRSGLRGARSLDFLVSLPIVIPGVVAGLAVLRTYIGLPVPIYGTIAILIVGYAMKYLPYSMRYSHAGILQMHSDLEESAAVCGASLWMRFRRIVVPLMLPALTAGGIYLFLVSSREFAMALLLYRPGTEVISVMVYELYQNGELPLLAAFAIVVSFAMMIAACVFMLFTRRFGVRAR